MASSKALAEINRKELNVIVEEIKETSKPMNESISLLYHVPFAVAMLNAITILAAWAPSDVSLITNDKPRSSFTFLKNPESFRASLWDLTTSLRNAFRVAHNSMGIIEATLTYMPGSIEEIFTFIIDKDIAADKKTQVLKRTLKKMKKASNECKKVAYNSMTAFSGARDFLDELTGETFLTQTASRTKLLNAQNTESDLKFSRQAHESELVRQNKAEEEYKKTVDEASKKYYNSMNGPNPFMALTLSLTDIFKRESSYKAYLDEKKDRRNTAMNQLNFENERKAKNAEAMRQKEMEIAEIMGKLQSLDLTKIDLQNIIDFLQKTLKYLNKINEDWNKLVMFFDEMNIFVERNFCNNMQDFIQRVKDEDPIKMLIKPAMVTCGLCVQVSNAASIYQSISKDLVISDINKVCGNLALTQDEAQAKKESLVSNNDKITKKVNELIVRKQKECQEKFDKKMDAINQKINLAITN